MHATGVGMLYALLWYFSLRQPVADRRLDTPVPEWTGIAQPRDVACHFQKEESMKRNIIIVVSLVIGFISCNNEGILFLRGNIQQKSDKHSLNTFHANDGCHIVVEIRKYPKNTADTPSEYVYKKEFNDIKSIPFYYELYGYTSSLFDDFKYDYYLNATVYNGKEEKLYIGDLVNEELTLINSWTLYKDINVYGLEDCSSDDAGGFCATEYR
jgi:hypothetical protein